MLVRISGEHLDARSAARADGATDAWLICASARACDLARSGKKPPPRGRRRSPGLRPRRQGFVSCGSSAEATTRRRRSPSAVAASPRTPPSARAAPAVRRDHTGPRACAESAGASVVRRQRRAAGRCGRMLAADSDEQMDERPAKPKRATRSDAPATPPRPVPPVIPAPGESASRMIGSRQKPASDRYLPTLAPWSMWSFRRSRDRPGAAPASSPDLKPGVHQAEKAAAATLAAHVERPCWPHAINSVRKAPPRSARTHLVTPPP